MILNEEILIILKVYVSLIFHKLLDLLNICIIVSKSAKTLLKKYKIHYSELYPKARMVNLMLQGLGQLSTRQKCWLNYHPTLNISYIVCQYLHLRKNSVCCYNFGTF